MKYADRYGNRWEKTGFQDCFLEKLYKSVPGRAVVKCWYIRGFPEWVAGC